MTNTVFKKTTVAVALVAAGIALGWGVSPVSYTHLTLPTICSV